MRAVLLENAVLSQGDIIDVSGEKLHHLLNVARIRPGQSLMILDGKGSSAVSEVVEIGRKRLRARVETVEASPSGEKLDVAFALPKKDALEVCLRSCAETGVRRIYIIHSDRSQHYSLKPQRIHKILAAGAEQSNNPFLPVWKELELKEVPWSRYERIALASLQNRAKGEFGSGGENLSTLLAVGPEGGFTEEEESFILNFKAASPLRYAGPILRAQTAISFFAGALAASRGDVIDA